MLTFDSYRLPLDDRAAGVDSQHEQGLSFARSSLSHVCAMVQWHSLFGRSTELSAIFWRSGRPPTLETVQHMSGHFDFIHGASPC